MPLRVCNDTCVHDRSVLLSAEEGEEDMDALMGSYAKALLEQIPCMRMTDVTGRESLRNSKDLVGIIYHTVKFCDYYGFEYSKLRKNCGVPLLKLESDYTAQSSGQLRTRLEAFAESLSPETAVDKKGRGQVKRGYFVGIDSGSTSTDVAILDQDKHLVAQVILPTGAGAAAGAERAMEAALAQAGLNVGDITATVTTGYGRSAIQLGDKSITEITCHAKGAFFLDPTVRTIIDIGGQVLAIQPEVTDAIKPGEFVESGYEGATTNFIPENTTSAALAKSYIITWCTKYNAMHSGENSYDFAFDLRYTTGTVEGASDDCYTLYVLAKTNPENETIRLRCLANGQLEEKPNLDYDIMIKG